MTGSAMDIAGPPSRRASPFGRGAVLGILLVGFAAFLAMLWFIGAGDTGGRGENNGAAHAASPGLNGYAGLVRLLRGAGHEVTLSRSPTGLETRDLLVIAPSLYSDGEELGELLEKRQNIGPTLVLLPKWRAGTVPRRAPREVRELFREGWVRLGGPVAPEWTADLPAPYSFETAIETTRKIDANDVEGAVSDADLAVELPVAFQPDCPGPQWSGFAMEGALPYCTVRHARPSGNFEALVEDDAGHTLAFNVLGEEGSEFYENAHWTVIVAEPDLVNNWGLADPARAAVALELVREAGYGEETPVTFDLTLNGFSGAQNLLSLAFAPPFLAATLCLILALVIVGWRAFMRFGATATSGPVIAFGKERLVTNGAGLIVRARRLRLVADPYTALSRRRIAGLLGLGRAEDRAIDEAIARRLPGEESFSSRAAALRGANNPTEILRAARALDDLARKLTT